MNVIVTPPSNVNVIVTPPPSVNVATIGTQGLQGPPGEGAVNTILVTKIAGESIGGGRVAIVQNDLVYYADSTNMLHRHIVIGITKHASTAGSNITIQTFGIMSEPTWNWIVGEPIFVGTNGLLTQTPPSAGFSLIIAKAITPTDIFISIEQPIIIGG